MSKRGCQRLDESDFFKLLEKLLPSLASFAVCFGVVFAVIQISQSVSIDRKQTTLDVLRSTREGPCLQAFRSLAVQREGGSSDLTASTLAEADLLLNAYDNIAIHYAAGELDRCLVKDSVENAIEDVIEDMKFVGYPEASYHRIIAFHADIKNLSCGR